ncbi:MAG: hypothetical protein HY094_06215 [Candidatus Melainabacteria bacterium]|nr:hypothetical protein [Candidatus Melainabacteria bacterium]
MELTKVVCGIGNTGTTQSTPPGTSEQKIITINPADILNQNADVLEALEARRGKQCIIRCGQGDLSKLDKNIPTDITRIHDIGAYDSSYPTAEQFKLRAQNPNRYGAPIPRITVTYPDRSFCNFTLDNRLPELTFFYDVQPLKLGETIVLVGGDDHTNDLIRLKNSSSTPSREIDHLFNIEFEGQTFNNVQIYSVYDVVLTDGEINIGLILNNPLKTIEISRGDSVIVTRIK